MSALSKIIEKHLDTKQPTTPLDSKPPNERTVMKGQKLTSTGMLKNHLDIIKQLEQTGIRAGFALHPEWEALLLGRGEQKQNLYDAIHRLRLSREGKPYKGYKQEWMNSPEVAGQMASSEPKKLGRPKGSRTTTRLVWTREQHDLALAIMNSPDYRTAKGSVNWEFAFTKHPDWATVLNYSKTNRGNFMSFIGRVRAGGGQRLKSSSQVPVHVPTENAVPVTNGEHFTILGREYQLVELEVIIREARNALVPIKFCPECGLNLGMHQKAYSIAKKHSNIDA